VCWNLDYLCSPYSSCRKGRPKFNRKAKSYELLPHIAHLGGHTPTYIYSDTLGSYKHENTQGQGDSYEHIRASGATLSRVVFYQTTYINLASNDRVQVNCFH
jgi:hypothetical protein